MAIITGAFFRDANGVPITNKGIITTKTREYDGTAGLGAAGSTTLFTVTGDVVVSVFAVCSENLASAGTIEVGITGNTAALIAQVIPNDIDAGEIWIDGTPATVTNYQTEKILTGGTDILEKIASADVTDGTLTFYCNWVPLSSTGNVVAA